MPAIKKAFLIILAFSFGAYELPFLLGPTLPKALPVQAYIEYLSPDLLNRPYAMALNGLIGAGVPQDWTTHMIGHEITAMFGVDHAKTLAILQPAIWEVRKDKKRAKLIQYAERVWNIEEVNDDLKIKQAIDKTRSFFEELGVKTHLSDYGITEDNIPNLILALEANHRTALSETEDLTLEISREILKKAL